MLIHIYLLKNDETTCDHIRFALRIPEYRITVFSAAADLFTASQKSVPDMILLDIEPPFRSGFDMVQSIRANERLKNIPLIIIAGESSEVDRAKGLDLGADDFIARPFGTLEFCARVRAVLRRNLDRPDETKYNYRDLVVDCENHCVYKNGVKINLTLKEYELLLYLMENKGRVITRDKLLSRLWNEQYDKKSRTIDMHIKTLRQKIGDSTNNPCYISTVRSIGYKMENDWPNVH